MRSRRRFITKIKEDQKDHEAGRSMPVISFGDGADQIWGGAGWAFRQALCDLLPYVRDDESLLKAIEQAGQIGFLGIEGLDAAVRLAMIDAIVRMCSDLTTGARLSSVAESLPDDLAAQVRYRIAIKDLLSIAQVAEQDLVRGRVERDSGQSG